MTVVKAGRETPEMVERKSASKSSEQSGKAGVDVSLTQAKVAGEVADLAIEDSESEKSFSEKEDSQKGKQASGGKKSAVRAAKTTLPAQPIPSLPVMKREVMREIRKKIRKEERKVLLVYVGVHKLNPHRLAELLAKVRQLKDLLSSLLDATKEVLIGLYLKWVRKET